MKGPSSGRAPEHPPAVGLQGPLGLVQESAGPLVYGDGVVPLAPPADVEHALAQVEPVQQYDEPRPGEGGLQPLKQPPGRLELAVLLVVFRLVLNGLRHQRDADAPVAHQGRLQLCHHVFPFAVPGGAVYGMLQPPPRRMHRDAVHGDQEASLEPLDAPDAHAVQHPAADEPRRHLHKDALELARPKPLHEMLDGVGVGDVLHPCAGDGVEVVEQERPAALVVLEAAPRRGAGQALEEDGQDEEEQRIDRLALLPGVGQGVQPPVHLREEVGDYP